MSIIGIDAETGEATESPDGEGVVPYFALVPIGVTAENIADTVIADELPDHGGDLHRRRGADRLLPGERLTGQGGAGGGARRRPLLRAPVDPHG